MGQKSQPVVGEQTRVDFGLIGEDVETGRAELTALKSSEKGLLVDDSSASGVDEHATLLHGAELLLAEEAASVGVEREVERDDVRSGEELVEGRNVGNGAFGLKKKKMVSWMFTMTIQVGANSRSQRGARGRQGCGCEKTKVSFDYSISMV